VRVCVCVCVSEGLYGYTTLEQGLRHEALSIAYVYHGHTLQQEARDVNRDARGPKVRLVLGDWHNESLLLFDKEHGGGGGGGGGGGRGGGYDVVLADFLLAAVHMHWPFAEDEVLLNTAP
jgi:hypothetical protein